MNQPDPKGSTMNDNSPTINVIAEIDTAINLIDDVVTHAPMDEPAMVDIAGELRAAARRITDMARQIESEIPDHTPIVGERWQTKLNRSASRSYNESAIIAALSAAYGAPPAQSVLAAVNDGGAKLSWSWTGLKKLFDMLNIPMTVTPSEVTDGTALEDGTRVHVGEVWSTRLAFEPVTDE